MVPVCVQRLFYYFAMTPPVRRCISDLFETLRSRFISEVCGGDESFISTYLPDISLHNRLTSPGCRLVSLHMPALGCRLLRQAPVSSTMR